MANLENRTYAEIVIGQSASLKRILTEKDIRLFAAISGDLNPAHLDKEFAHNSIFHDIIGHGIWGGSLISAVLGTLLPGPGTIYLSQQLKFLMPVRLGDEVTASVTVLDKRDGNKIVLDCECRNQNQDVLMAGEAIVLAPDEKVTRPMIEMPQAYLHECPARLNRVIEQARDGAPIRTGVVHPVNAVSMEGVMASMEQQLITPILIGPVKKIETTAAEVGFNLQSVEIVDTPHSHAAAAKAVSMVRDGKLDAVMKGALHTDEIMSEVVSRSNGIRTERRVSHIYVMDTPAYDKLLFISDAAINITPDLEDKRDIVQNAIDLAISLGVLEPKAAILSAVETVYPKLQSTLDAAALCKMADRGQITGGIVDGPLAFDNAISRAAANAKGLQSRVAGQADILIVPGLEAGNMLAKELDYLAGAVAAGIVLGAQVPIILTSRAEGKIPRMAASAIAKLHHYRNAVP